MLIIVLACLVSKYSSTTSVLIDDRISFKEEWEANGGIFVHHVSAEDTIQQLIDHGILSEEDHRTAQKD